jgi:hypothetical protein
MSIPYNPDVLYNIASPFIGLSQTQWEEVKILAELQDGGTLSFANNTASTAQPGNINLAVRKLSLLSDVSN